jgi:hypothetical protein
MRTCPHCGAALTRPDVGRPRVCTVQDLVDCLGDRVLTSGEFLRRANATLDVSKSTFYRLLYQGCKEFRFRETTKNPRPPTVMDTPCVLSLGKVHADGYASCYSVAKRKMVPAHRLAWEEVYGPIPPRLWVLHKCDVRNCVNPAHLFLGTAADNARDMHTKGRGQTTWWCRVAKSQNGAEVPDSLPASIGDLADKAFTEAP